MRKLFASALLAAATLASTASPALADSPVGRGTIWLDGVQVRTLVTPSAFPNEGRDDFYRVPGTGGVAAVGPGTGDYHGGAWKVFDVTWNVAPYPLTSAGAVLGAAAAGKVTTTRNASADFRCPIQP
jgi:hypothetical protein